MTKRLEDEFNKMVYNNQPMKLNLVGLVLMFSCTFLIISATFFNISFDYGKVFSASSESAVYNYIPQIPIIIMIAALLGPRMGCLSVLMYLVAGLFFPVFALGGGIQYILQPGFGYILSYIPAVVVAGSVLRKNFKFSSVLKAACFGTLIIHLCGLVYALLVMMLSHNFYGNVVDFILMQSTIKLLLDFIFCIIAAYAALFIKKLLWLVIG